MSAPARVAAVAPRRLTGVFWHQGPTRHELVSCADPSRGEGRYHRVGEPGVWYASSQEQGAWAELFRHFTAEGVDPFEVQRRIGRVRVDLEVLDLTDVGVRETLGLALGDLTGDDYRDSQAVAAAARDAGFQGVLAPSAALPGRTTLVVFAAALDAVHADGSQVRQPPPRLASLLPLIRPHETVPGAVRRAFRTLAAAGVEPIRRRRR